MKVNVLKLHPAGKQGVNIHRHTYDLVKNTMVDVLRNKSDLTFKKLTRKCTNLLRYRIDGKITWYPVTVKPNPEAQKIIERVPKTKPAKLRLK